VTFEIVNRLRAATPEARGLAAFGHRLAGVAPRTRATSVTVCLAGDALVKRLNGAYRGKHRTTDVLSFPAGDEAAPDGSRHLGDVVISIPQTRRQAAREGRAPARELRLLLLHGYLHLLGYDHEVDDGTMKRLESRLAARLLPEGRKR
jgi:probable rRNA maturation factor